MAIRKGEDGVKKRKARSSCAGATLVEMIVTFALTGIFMVAAAAMAGSAMQVFGRIKETGYAQSVCDMILDRTEAELSTASTQDVRINAAGTISSGGKNVALADAQSVCCQTGAGARICIFATPYDAGTKTGGQYVVHYYGDTLQPATDWSYDDAALLDYRVETLAFSKVDDSTVQASLTVVSLRTGYTYRASRVIPCYYLKKDDVHRVATAQTIWN
jgi:hypothetical protein